MGIKIKVITPAVIAIMAIYGFLAFDKTRSHTTEISPQIHTESIAIATFAGGCFWCTESDFEHKEGVISALSGYTGGTTKNPSYHEVSAGNTGHYEAVEVRYDPTKTSYDDLLDYFLEHIDPTDPNGQFVDQGSSYRSAIFYHTEEERAKAETALGILAKSGVFGTQPIATAILPTGPFYAAEEYHQDYYKKNPIRYDYYRSRSGRDAFLKKWWTQSAVNAYKKLRSSQLPIERQPQNNMSNWKTFIRPADTELKARLTPLQYAVTQQADTEPPFNNEYADEHRAGIYVDIVSGEPLFSSLDKYDSGTGWPSFVRPLIPENIIEETDYWLIYPRTEIRSKRGGSHLGHLFADGPADRGGKRYCMNSVAMRFIPKENLEKEGYGEFTIIFTP